VVEEAAAVEAGSEGVDVVGVDGSWSLVLPFCSRFLSASGALPLKEHLA
jgi:hypothetical protein